MYKDPVHGERLNRMLKTKAHANHNIQDKSMIDRWWMTTTVRRQTSSQSMCKTKCQARHDNEMSRYSHGGRFQVFEVTHSCPKSAAGAKRSLDLTV